MTTSRTVSDPVKCFPIWGAVGMDVCLPELTGSAA
jgi:hypothetical protein